MNAIDQAFIRAYETEEPTLLKRESTGEPNAAARLAGRGESRPSGIDSASPLTSNLNERRPLSSFAAKQPLVEARFKPALEVDAFRWSQVCETLLGRFRDRLLPAVDSLLAADDAGRSLIGVAAATRGAGCTTLVTCLARLLAEAGKTVAIVDGDFAAPGLARQLGLAVQTGWEEVLSGRLPLAEGIILSLKDRIALLPLATGGAAAAVALDSIHASVTAGVLRYHYDVVLFDLGAVGDPLQSQAARRLVQQCRLDGALVATSYAGGTAAQSLRLHHTAPELAAVCMGIVESDLRAA